MKAIVYKSYYLLAVLFVMAMTQAFAQENNNRSLDNFRYPDKRGINVFEAPKDTISTFDGVKVRIGGSSTLQFQGIDHSNYITGSGEVDSPNELIGLAKNFNLATANLDLDVALAPGVRMHLRTYLSSRHHPEPYVKGGYFQIDNLDFVKEGFLGNVMDYMTIKVGHMENNYGDAHFRRTDNASAMYNPFVGNLIMDGFTTEVGGEFYFRNNGWIGMVGLTNGKLNQAPTDPGGTGVAFLGKLGYDSQVNENVRLRLTGSIYTIGNASRLYLYSADRTGSRYYRVMEPMSADGSDNFRSGRWNPNFADHITAVMINPFVKVGGLEFFGTIETSKGGDSRNNTEEDRTWNQFAGELLYRFGPRENVYVGGRYNTASGKLAAADASEVTINRTQFGAGWFLTKNILAKFEYVTQKYKDFPTGDFYNDGKFDGYMIEAVIAF